MTGSALTVFVGYPWGSAVEREQYKAAYEHVRARVPGVVFKFAEDRISDRHVLEHIEGLIRDCDLGIYDVTGWNPNVTLEYGLARGLKQPALIAFNPRLTNIHDVPSDVRGFGRLQYESLDELSQRLFSLLADPHMQIGGMPIQLRRLLRGGFSERASVFANEDALYDAINALIMSETLSTRHDRFMYMAASHHASPGDRRHSEHGRALREAMWRRVAEGWSFRRIVSLSTPAHLAWELEQNEAMEEHLGEAVRFELRAVRTRHVPLMLPIIAGTRIAALGREDSLWVGVAEGLVFTEPEAVSLTTRYFQSIWEDPRAHVLRTEAGLNSAGIEALEQELYAEHPAESSEPV